LFTDVVFIENDRIATVTENGTLYLLDTTASVLATFETGVTETRSLAWNPQEQLFAIGGAQTVINETGVSGLRLIEMSILLPSTNTQSITITQSDNATIVAESGTTDTYTLVLGTQPTADVVVSVTGTDQVSVSPTTLTFTPENWDIPQMVTVSAADDSVVEGAHIAVITHSAVSTDAGYDGLAVADVSVGIEDNDVAGVTVTQSDASLHARATKNASCFPFSLLCRPGFGASAIRFSVTQRWRVLATVSGLTPNKAAISKSVFPPSLHNKICAR
jgi:hypothetical protein